MKERPILMSAFSVRAILDGRKTQTRRPIKPQPADNIWRLEQLANDPLTWIGIDLDSGSIVPGAVWKCPFGQSADRLWVRETIWREFQRIGVGPYDGHDPNEEDIETGRVYYAADGGVLPLGNGWWERRPSIFMRRTEARIVREILDVHPEPLQNISAEDALAEGCPRSALHDRYDCENGTHIIGPVAWFASLWDSIYVKRGFGWNANPWVWVVALRET